jgi:hypothetical protein
MKFLVVNIGFDNTSDMLKEGNGSILQIMSVIPDALMHGSRKQAV